MELYGTQSTPTFKSYLSLSSRRSVLPPWRRTKGIILLLGEDKKESHQEKNLHINKITLFFKSSHHKITLFFIFLIKISNALLKKKKVSILNQYKIIEDLVIKESFNVNEISRIVLSSRISPLLCINDKTSTLSHQRKRFQNH